jgi:hypothetical protein
MGLLGAGSGSGTASGKQIGAGSDAPNEEELLDQVIETEVNETGQK